ncbi:telomerase-binding EST1A protein [Rutstroemia sp. NJR-2017a WRK4]|nr:telomerase-binding EST1A protein [Rutstroemia sp. NJR-2017a WRK4]
MDRFDAAVNKLLALLDSHIGRVTKKFLEQGYQISISNAVVVLCFVSKDNPIMKAIALALADKTDVQMEGTQDDLPLRDGYFGTGVPWQSLVFYLNTFLTSYATIDRIQDDKFPLPEKDDVRPFPEDYAMRGLLYIEKLYPEK